MKIRKGFVSNSSSTSFTIYGWDTRILSVYISLYCPLFKGVVVEFEFEDDGNKVINNLQQYYQGDPWDLVSCKNSEGISIFGVGRHGDECDHGAEPNKNGYYFDDPSEWQKEQMDKIADKFNMPKPRIYRETFRD